MTTATVKEPRRINRYDLRLDDPEGALRTLPPHDDPDFADQGYRIPDFFDSDDRYLGPDCLGVRILDGDGRPLEVGELVVGFWMCAASHDEPTPATLEYQDGNGDVWRYCAGHAGQLLQNAVAFGFDPPVLRAV